LKIEDIRIERRTAKMIAIILAIFTFVSLALLFFSHEKYLSSWIWITTLTTKESPPIYWLG
jgi:hypothetical protein